MNTVKPMENAPPPSSQQHYPPSPIGSHPESLPQYYAEDICAPPPIATIPGRLFNWKAHAFNADSTSPYKIYGHDTQILQVKLNPGENVTSEPGALVFKGANIKMKTSVGGFGKGLKRLLGGETFFKNTYINKSPNAGSVSLTPDYPAKVAPLNLSKTGSIICVQGAYLAHLGDVTVDIKFITNCFIGCCAGQGFILQKFHGSGTVFVCGGGTIMEKMLQPNEILLVDPTCLIGYSETCTFDVETSGDGCTMMFGGEGLFVNSITGPGLVLVETMPKNKLRWAITPIQSKSK